MEEKEQTIYEASRPGSGEKGRGGKKATQGIGIAPKGPLREEHEGAPPRRTMRLKIENFSIFVVRRKAMSFQRRKKVVLLLLVGGGIGRATSREVLLPLLPLTTTTHK